MIGFSEGQAGEASLVILSARVVTCGSATENEKGPGLQNNL